MLSKAWFSEKLRRFAEAWGRGPARVASKTTTAKNPARRYGHDGAE